jgi:hypothetical protein
MLEIEIDGKKARAPDGGTARKKIAALSLLLLSMALPAFAQANVDAFPDLDLLYEPQPVRHFDPEADPSFSEPELALKMRVIYEEEIHRVNHRANHFCLIGYEWQDGKREVPVFWRELEEVTWWQGRNSQSADSEYGVNSLYLYSRHTNMERDTVSTVADLGTSTYLRVRSGVISVIRDCARNGRWYVIEPFEIPPVCDSGLGECEMPDVHPLSRRAK